MHKEQLISAIRSAFTDEIYPGDGNLIYDKSGTHLECEQVRTAFTRKRWEQLDKPFLINHRQDYTCFSGEAFRYYLPAFLLLVISDFDEADDLPFNLVSALTLPTEFDTVQMANAVKSSGLDKQMPDIDFEFILQNQLHYTNQDVHNFFVRFGALKRTQSEAVKHFLEYVQQEHGYEFLHDEPTTALTRYWFQFAT